MHFRPMHDAGLRRGLWEHSFDRFGEALQPINNGDQYVRYAAGFQFIQNRQPEVGAFDLSDPQNQNLVPPDNDRSSAT